MGLGGLSLSVLLLASRDYTEMNWNIFCYLDLGDVHVAGVLSVGVNTMILLDNGVKHISKHLGITILVAMYHKYLSWIFKSFSGIDATHKIAIFK